MPGTCAESAESIHLRRRGFAALWDCRLLAAALLMAASGLAQAEFALGSGAGKMPDVAALVHELEHGTAAARAEAAESLAQLGENAQAAAIPLVRATASDDETVREWATSALEDLGPPSRDDLQALMTLLEHPALDPAYWAATLLGRLHAEAGDAVAALAKALTHPEMAVRERAAWALGEIGSAALGAKAELEQAAQASPPRLAKLARAALDNLKS